MSTERRIPEIQKNFIKDTAKLIDTLASQKDGEE